jgi:SAM-dependent methyltransferase
MNILNDLWVHFISFGFYLLYHQLAPTFDMVSWIVSFGKWRQWQLASLPFVKGPDVLELAHGPGHVLLALQRAGYNVTGSDLSPQMGRLAIRKIRASEAPVAILQAPAQKQPFAAGSFDSILTTFPTEFIAEQACLDEVHRLLRADGRFVIIPQARLTGGSLAVRLLKGLYRITGQRNIPEAAPGHDSTSPLFGAIQRQFIEAGFDIREERLSQPGSEVTILVATKQDARS